MVAVLIPGERPLRAVACAPAHLSALASDDRGASLTSRPAWALDDVERIRTGNKVLDGKQTAGPHANDSTAAFRCIGAHDQASLHHAVRLDLAMDVAGGREHELKVFVDATQRVMERCAMHLCG